MDSLLAVPVFKPAGAGIALRRKPHLCWELGRRAGIPTVQDKHVGEVKVETGDTASARVALALEAYLTVGDPEHVPQVFDDQIYDDIRAWATSETRNGRTRFLLSNNPVPTELLAELQGWLETTLGVYLLVLDRPDDSTGSLYSFDERLLLARIASFLLLLDQPEWRCERQD